MPEFQNGPPSVSDLARRLQRIEVLLDERLVTKDMLIASEKLYEARAIAHGAEMYSAKERISKLEASMSRFSFMLLGAFLMLLVQFIVLIIQVTSRGGG